MLNRSPLSNNIQTEYDQLFVLITEIRSAFRSLYAIQKNELRVVEFKNKYYDLFKSFDIRITGYLSITLSNQNTLLSNQEFGNFKATYNDYVNQPTYNYLNQPQYVHLRELEQTFNNLVQHVGVATALSQTMCDNQYHAGMSNALNKIDARLANIEKQLAPAPKQFLPNK